MQTQPFEYKTYMGNTYHGLWRNPKDETLMVVVDWERQDEVYFDTFGDILVLFQMSKGTLSPSGTIRKQGGGRTSRTPEYESIMPKRDVRLAFYTSVGGLSEGMLSAVVRK